MATDTIQLSTNIGVGDKLSANELAGGEKVQNIKILSAEDGSETQIYAGNGTAANSLRVSVASDSTGQVKLAAGTAAVGTVILGTGTASAGTVGLNAGSAAIGSAIVGGSVAHDASGTSVLPILGGTIAVNQDGTSSGTSVAENDLTYSKSDRDGLMFVNQTHPYLFSASSDFASAATNSTIQAAVASVSIHVTDITLSNGAVAGNMTLLDGSGGTVLFEAYLAVNSNLTISLRNPLRLTANTLLAFTSTSSTTHAVNISGYYAV